MSIAPEVLSADGEVIQPHIPSLEYEHTSAHHEELPGWIQTITYFTALFLLLALPLTFGGVHPKAFLSAECIAFALTTLIFIAGGHTLRLSVFSADSAHTTRIALLTLCGLLAYVFIHTVILGSISTPHPVLGTTSLLLNTQATLAAARQLLFFITSVVIVRTLCATTPRTHFRLLSAVIIVGIIVAFIGLAHWFYDNGLLFWIFEPEYVFVSERARWPFVNSNHLGHFLLPVFFLLIGRILAKIHGLKTLKEERSGQKQTFLSLFLSSKTFQNRTLVLTLYIIGILAVALCIAGTQSRGTWLGVSIGVFLFIVAKKIAAPKKEHANHNPNLRHSLPRDSIEEEEPEMHDAHSHSRSGRGRRRRSSRRNSKDGPSKIGIFLKKSITPAAIFGAFLVFLLFLNQRGVELVAGRINYGLLYSKDDVRWELYADTSKMIADHPLFGVGFGAWASKYPEYMNPILSGINPVYLHSDPLQIVAELGIVAALPLLFLLALVLRNTWRYFRREQATSEGSTILSLGIGLISIIIASLLDFPFRIPGITYLCAVTFSLLLFYLDNPSVKIGRGIRRSAPQN